MVLCKFFQQGSCRFGSKCVNEHLDVKQMIKTDVEAAIHGKQWPLSTYGPFRDKPSIPNFIEDQSFEEVRMLCYEAKQKNFFDQFHQQFSKEAVEASNKMNALLQMTSEVVDVLIKVYDVPSDTSGNGVSVGKSTNNASNPFGLGHSSKSGSIFAKSATNSSANNLFSNSNNTFATSNQGTSGLFASTSAFAPPQQASIFAQPMKPTNAIFGVNNNTNNQHNASIFAQQPSQSNFFNASTQQQQTTSNSGIFSQNQFMQQPQQQSSNIFRQALQPTQPQQGLFAQASQTMQQQLQQVQPQQGLFTQTAQQTAAGQGLFAQVAQQTQNIFSQTLQQQNGSNIFQQNLPSSAPQQQQTNANIFQQNQPIVNPQYLQNQQPASGCFQQTSQQAQNTPAPGNQLPQFKSTVYSRLEDLTADEMDAFKADYFLPGKIPFNPPPRELIN